MILKKFSLFLFYVGMIIGGCSSSDHKVNIKPNIIYILADDLGIGDLSFYGQKKFSTPNIDFLAENGMHFTQHYSGSSVCAPSRSVLMTGLHTGHTPIRSNKKTAMPDSIVTVAELLKGAGYTTGIFGKWSLGLLTEKGPDEGYPTKQGFDIFVGYDNQTLAHRYYPPDIRSNDSVFYLPGNDGIHTVTYAPDVINSKALEFIDNNKERPFFLYYPTIIPHAELILPHDSLLNKFKGKFQEQPWKGNDYGADNFSLAGYCSVDYPNATLAGMITLLDIYIGKIIKKLEDENLLDNTIICFASDNGAASAGGRDRDFFNSTGNLRGAKGTFFEGGVRTPFFVFWKGKVLPGSKTDHISAFEDVMPTFAEIAGCRIPDNIDGLSFLPSLLGRPQEKNRDYLYWEINTGSHRQAIRKGNWKAILFDKPGYPISLFDLDKDPYETTDVSNEFPKVVSEMRILMKNARTCSSDYILFPDEK